MSKFLLTGNGPLSNRGCEAIVRGTIKILEREFGPSEFILASFADDSRDVWTSKIRPVALDFECPRFSSAWWRRQLHRFLGIPVNRRRFLQPLIGLLREGAVDLCAAFSIGGDGYATDYGHFIVDMLEIMDGYLMSEGIPLVIWGASIGPFSGEPEYERRMASHFAKVDLVVVRERRSLDYLRSLGVVHNVHLSPDPAFVIDCSPCCLPDDVEKALEKPCLGVNLSPLLARYLTGGDVVEWQRVAAACIGTLLERYGMPVVLIPHVTSHHGDIRMDDYLFLRKVLSLLDQKHKGWVALVPPGLNSENLKWVISRTTAFIGARTHSLIAALSTRVPSLSIAYSRKAWGIAELVFGHTGWVLSAAQLTPQRLRGCVGDLLENRDRIQSYLHRVMPGMIENAYNSAKRVGEVLRTHEQRR